MTSQSEIDAHIALLEESERLVELMEKLDAEEADNERT